MSNNDILVYKLPCTPKEDEIDVLSKDRELSILAASSCVNETHRLALSPESFSVCLDQWYISVSVTINCLILFFPLETL